jgi:hypothetical protein
MTTIRHYRELNVYQSAMEWTMSGFNQTRAFPPEAKYALTDSVAWRRDGEAATSAVSPPRALAGSLPRPLADSPSSPIPS